MRICFMVVWVLVIFKKMKSFFSTESNIWTPLFYSFQSSLSFHYSFFFAMFVLLKIIRSKVVRFMLRWLVHGGKFWWWRWVGIEEEEEGYKNPDFLFFLFLRKRCVLKNGKVEKKTCCLSFLREVCTVCWLVLIGP